MKTIVLGSGISGLASAIFCHLNGDDVSLITKSKITHSNSYYAQGGIVYEDSDPHSLISDILKVSSYSSDKKTVQNIVTNANKAIKELLIDILNVPFEKKNSEFKLRKEGGHSKKRILYYQDITGKIIVDYLFQYIKNNTNIHIYNNSFALKIITTLKSEKTAIGLQVVHDHQLLELYGEKIILAGGGIGECFKNTSNPKTATGDVIAMAYDIGISISNMHYTQFHPTVFASPKNSHRKFLLSEALRGQGAILVNEHGKDFMKDIHPLGSLAPRDIVSQSIYREIQKSSTDHVYLDVTSIDKSIIEKKFPTIFKYCLDHNIDMRIEPIPTHPAYHFLCGGINTDMNGKTSIHNLFAIGECANNGLHGANRLASTSLMECITMAKIVSNQRTKKNTDEYRVKHRSPFNVEEKNIKKINQVRKQVQKEVWENLGIIRHPHNINQLYLKLVETLKEMKNLTDMSIQKQELINIITCSLLISKHALDAQKSLGCHYIVND